MINGDAVVHASGLVLLILISATVISYTSRIIFGSEKGEPKKPPNQIYDPDHGRNMTHVCVASGHPYGTEYEDSPCFNRTHLLWYNPWLRHDLWRRFWTELEARKKKSPEGEAVVAPRVLTPNETDERQRETPEPPGDHARERPKEKPKEKPIEFVYTILVGLLTMSVGVACWEVFKDKLAKNEAAAARGQERQCTLADFTINRHLRRESQAQAASHLQRQASLELTAKVTQPLIHQSSLDRAFPHSVPEAMSSADLRRNSVPFHLGADAQPGSPGLKRNRLSVDMSGEESRKKPRYFIRRH